MTEFTPGPWKIAALDENGQRIVASQHTEICTCWHHCVKEIEQQMEANAYLIAAVPELLATLEEGDGLIAWLSELDLGADTRAIIATFDRKRRAAIAKARNQ